MTSRDELLRLVEQLETDHCHCDTHPRYIGQKCLPCKAAAAIRELLAQEPVGCVLPDGVGVYLDKPLQPDADLYAAPVPAVDLEAFKQEAMRLARECSHRLANEANWHALAAHLDKLGGK